MDFWVTYLYFTDRVTLTLDLHTASTSHLPLCMSWEIFLVILNFYELSFTDVQTDKRAAMFKAPLHDRNITSPSIDHLIGVRWRPSSVTKEPAKLWFITDGHDWFFPRDAGERRSTAPSPLRSGLDRTVFCYKWPSSIKPGFDVSGDEELGQKKTVNWQNRSIL